MKTVLIYSGGLDSTVLLHDLLDQGDQVVALSIDYGQRHRRELIHAEKISKTTGVEWQIADLSPLVPFLAGSSQTSPEIAVPHGHYAAESMKLTVVPNRNMIMLAVAAGWAISLRADRVSYGAHTGDHTIYPDCRPEFVDAMQSALRLADWHPLLLHTPYLQLTKAQIVRRGAALGVDFSQTWSCYEGGAQHCGMCGTCTERKEAFALAGVADPTEYTASSQ
ncbi:MAG: 7-cyano-7-deazaguanine synthase QueC [Pirellulales bacterium]|nr:7-cyano-7-deazaguanine synthase QueC [Pirellulales bacterium]